MRLGLGSFTYTWAVGVPGHHPPAPLTAKELLGRAHALGIGVVQFCDNLPLTMLSPEEFEACARLAEEWRMEVEIGTRGLDPGNLLAHLPLAKRLRSRFLRVVIDARGDEPSPEETVRRLGPVVERFAEAGVRLAIENHDRFPARVLANIVEKLGPEKAGICLDTVNSFGALEGPEHVVGVLAPYTLNLHVKDFTIARVGSQMGFVVRGCAVGDGRLDVPWLLGSLRAAGRDCNAIVELWTPREVSLEQTIALEAAWAEKSVRYMRRFVDN